MPAPLPGSAIRMPDEGRRMSGIGYRMSRATKPPGRVAGGSPPREVHMHAPWPLEDDRLVWVSSHPPWASRTAAYPGFGSGRYPLRSIRPGAIPGPGRFRARGLDTNDPWYNRCFRRPDPNPRRRRFHRRRRHCRSRHCRSRHRRSRLVPCKAAFLRPHARRARPASCQTVSLERFYS